MPDVAELQRLINSFADRGAMLPRALNTIYENLRDFVVAESDGKITGCCALHVTWEDLAEIKSVAVKKTYHGKGIGKQLIAACMAEGKDLGIRKYYVLTYVPDFFKHFGFKRIDRKVLPHKVWTECVKCPKFPDCDEIAMMLEPKKVRG